MNEQADENAIAELLEGLSSTDVNIRKDAIQSIIKLEIKDERIINALIRIAGSDGKQSARIFAKNALGWLEIEYSLPEVDVPVEEEVEEVSPIVEVPPEPVTDISSFPGRYKQQIAGFIGWFVIATFLSGGSVWGLITTPATVLALILYTTSKQSRGVAGGILIAVALNFVVSLVRGLSLNAWCLIPFYNNIY